MATAEHGAWQLQGAAAGSRQGHLGDSQAENNTPKVQTLHLARLPGYSPQKITKIGLLLRSEGRQPGE